MVARTTQNLETFVVIAIRDSISLTPAEKQSLLSDFFNLVYRSSSMGGLLKDLFGIQPAPPPPINCDKTIILSDYTPTVVLSEGYSSGNYVPTQDIKCTYTFTSSISIEFVFDAGNEIGTGASPKFISDPSTPSYQQDAAGTLYSTGPSAIVVFNSKAGASSKWKITAS